MNEDKRKALTIAGAGVAFFLLAFLLNAMIGLASPRLAQSFALAMALGSALCVWGCIQLARAKGRPWYFGLLGLLNALGLAILWFAVPDKP